MKPAPPGRSVQIVAIHEATLPMASSIRNAVIDFSQMTTSAVAVVTDVVRAGAPVIGYGFNSNGRYAQGGILRERMIPRLLAAADALADASGANLNPHKAWRVMMANEKPGGHGDRSVAVGVLDMALWDAVAKIEGRPLYRVLADRYHDGVCDDAVEVYAAGGYYESGHGQPGQGLGGLRAELRSYLDRGYTTVKMKVGGAPRDEDLRRIEAALEVVDGDGSRLAVDANARFEPEEAVDFARAIAPYGLRWFEEPCDPLDFAGHAAVSAASTTPLATGENLFSMVDVRNMVRHGGLRPERDTLQVDPVLAYGLVEYLRVLEMLEAHGWSRRRCVPHGGHQFALHIAAGLGLGGNEAYPDVFRPFGGFADTTPVEDGRIRLTESPGIGFEEKADLFPVLRGLLDAAPSPAAPAASGADARGP